jgi:O-antigen/teichoic acid export membrane protein
MADSKALGMISPALKVVTIAKRYGGNFAANIFQQGLRFIVLYAAAKKLGPKEFGVFSMVLLVSNYLLNSGLGAVNGLKRQIPLVYSGRGEKFTLDAFFSVLNFNLCATFIFTAIASLVLINFYGFEPAAGIVLILLSLSANTYFSIQTFFTSTGNWNNLLKLQLLCGLFLSLAVLSTFFFNYIILTIAYALCFLFASLRFFVVHGYRPIFDMKVIRENVNVGLFVVPVY